MRTLQKAALAAAAALVGLSAATTPAGAAPVSTGGDQAAPIISEAGPTGVPTASCSHPIKRWGYWGCYKGGPATAYDIDWDRNGTWDQTFVIAPNREIWHVWKGAGSWKEVPYGHGYADHFLQFDAPGAGVRCVAVWAAGRNYVNVFAKTWLGWQGGLCY
ncbi:hypothetical protein ACFQVC_09800 [Streptomyces monticola]|uniref:Secreted protein n=1 Tax=Streptomyces monticola TaxID=2666263 RepID=A0ABW2JEP1_9ACTN